MTRTERKNALWLGMAWYLAIVGIWQGSWYLYEAFALPRERQISVPGLDLYLSNDAAVIIQGFIGVTLGLALIYQMRGDYDKWLRITLYAYVVYSVLIGALFFGSIWATGKLTISSPAWWVGSAFISYEMILHHPMYGMKLRLERILSERKRISEAIARNG